MLKTCQVVGEHYAIHWMVLLGLQFVHSQHCELQSLASHNTFKDMHCDFYEFNLVYQYSLLLSSIDHAHIVPDCEVLGLIRVPHHSQIVFEGSGE